jgi:glucosyl-3-phosphoglycerate synthase
LASLKSGAEGSFGIVVREQMTGAGSLERWFERRSFDHSQFADLDSLARRKRKLALSVTAIMPGREVAPTVGTIIDEIQALNERAALVDQLIVVDARSADGTAGVARRHGAEVHFEDELLPQFGPVIGKGDAMWRALSVARGDLVMYLDSDTTDFEQRFVYGLLGPLLTVPEIRFVKASYSRPWSDGERVEPDNGGRVTELTTRPLFNLFYPELTGFAQPLAGEIAAPRDLFRSIPFFTGYAVETGMMIDVLRAAGLERMAQVDLGVRTNRSQSLFDLSKMAYAVTRAVEIRLRREGRLRGPGEPGQQPSSFERDGYVHAIRSSDTLRLERSVVEVVERPPMAEALAAALRE